MFDTGSSDSLSPDFTWVVGLKVFGLTKALNVQLGTVGSQSRINFGTKAVLHLNPVPVEEEYYFDVFNIDRYDCILGTPSMWQFVILLDLSNNVVMVCSVKYPALSAEDTIEQMCWSAARVVEHPSQANPTTNWLPVLDSELKLVSPTLRSGTKPSGEPIREKIEHTPHSNIWVWMIKSREELNDIEKIDVNIEIVQESSCTRFTQRPLIHSDSWIPS